MDKKTTLVVLAAGMGSRYGGLKQIDKIGPNNETILELSVYDAIRAGFNKVVFVIKKEMEATFKEVVGDTIAKHIEVEYAYQSLDAMLPKGFNIENNRIKPWGTGHALLCAKDKVKEVFGVINADDYYGMKSFQVLHDFLVNNDRDYAIVGFQLKNTLSEYGSVSRGICEVNNGYLTTVVERKQIENHEGKISYFENDGWHEVSDDALASMNMWGFNLTIFDCLQEKFEIFLQDELKLDPLKKEFYLPFAVDEAIHEKIAQAKMLTSDEKWYGVTYQEDKAAVRKGISDLISNGRYPQRLWED